MVQVPWGRGGLLRSVLGKRCWVLKAASLTLSCLSLLRVSGLGIECLLHSGSRDRGVVTGLPPAWVTQQRPNRYMCVLGILQKALLPTPRWTLCSSCCVSDPQATVCTHVRSQRPPETWTLSSGIAAWWGPKQGQHPACSSRQQILC